MSRGQKSASQKGPDLKRPDPKASGQKSGGQAGGGQGTAAAGLPARRAALALLESVLGDGQMLQGVLADPKGPLAGLDGSERARAQRLAHTVLRHMERADRMLGPHLRKVPPLVVVNALRLAVVEVMVDRSAAHGAVNAAVELVRHGARTGHLTGLVNAVLRKVVAEPHEVWDRMPPQRMPGWLRKRLVAIYGRPTVEAMERVQMLGAPLDLTLKPGLAAGADLVATALPTGSYRRGAVGQISDLPGYAAGEWWVQDAAAALPARVLAVTAGEQVLDLCAAPGGKTLQLAAAGAEVTALDISGPRVARLRENLARTGLAAQAVVADALVWEPGGLFDAVLLDAPCSATGTIRRHPDLPFVKTEADLPDLLALQRQLFDRALGFLKPGGRLVYCTCSLLPEEGEAQVLAALARHPGLITRPQALDLAGVSRDWLTAEGGLRLRPDYWADAGGMDGFYIALVRKPA